MALKDKELDYGFQMRRQGKSLRERSKELEEEKKLSESLQVSESDSDNNFSENRINLGEDNMTERNDKDEENKSAGNLRDGIEESKSSRSWPEASRLTKRKRMKRSRRPNRTETSKSIKLVDILNALRDPYFGVTMINPYITPQGNTYEESKIREYIKMHGTDPISGEELREEDLKRNEELFDLVNARFSRSSHISN
eukprot:CAMPEP_0197010728 /NCGR_PEP_ID=MMETSP1380-20130617/55616_1 /TAXON_ID=5936 /ORGANISM="Euplotes crassus, Strain CT5" /LENGTH=196 /DNA_ID=CAMNT_0042432867 /DNA_START=582 /DNA_END=1169 /DNA_ORIENTATION=+